MVYFLVCIEGLYKLIGKKYVKQLKFQVRGQIGNKISLSLSIFFFFSSEDNCL